MPRSAFLVRGAASRLRDATNDYALRGTEPAELTVSPAALGPAVLHAPAIDQAVDIGRLGGASLFTPSVDAQLDLALLGGAVLFTPNYVYFVGIGRALAREELTEIAIPLDEAHERAGAFDELVEETS